MGQTRGIEEPRAIFPSLCPIFPGDARRIDIGISIGVLLFTYRRETTELNFIVGNE